MRASISVYGQRKLARRKVAQGRGNATSSRFEMGYVAAFSLLFCLLYFAGRLQLFPWAVLVIVVFCLMLHRPSLPVLYSAFLVGNEAASTLILIVWMIGSREAKLGELRDVKLDKVTLFLVLAILTVSLAQAWRAGTVANTALSAIYLCILGVLAFSCAQAIEYGALLRCTRLFIVGEFVVSMVICARVGLAPGDAHYGTLFNAHFFGIFCLVALILVVRDRRRGEVSAARAAVLMAMLGFMMWDADAKSALGAGIACVVVFLLFWFVKPGAGTITVFFWTFLFFFVAASLAMSMPGAREVLTSDSFPFSSFFSEYVYDDGVQNKFDYFMGTATQMTIDGHILYGYGLGTYGSRFANMLGYTYTYRDPSAFNDLAAALFSSRMIPEYIPFASAYSAELHSVIQWLSAVLTYPFSSVVAWIGETGVLGVVTMGIVLRKLNLGLTSQSLVAMFIGVCITDMYFDRLQVIGLVIMAVAGLESLRRTQVARASSTSIAR